MSTTQYLPHHLPFALADVHGPPRANMSTTTLTPSTLAKNQPSPPLSDQPQTFATRLSHAALNLPPAFFSINMGTGITSILLYNLPYNADWLKTIGIVIFVLNLAVFALLAVANVYRYIRWKGLFGAVGRHGMSGMFWGCLPMGLATIINMIVFVCVPTWGYSWARMSLGLWWIDVLLSVGINIGMLFMLFSRHSHTAETVSAAWLLPIVTSVVAAASGGVVASALAPFNPDLAKSTVVVSYVIWGTGVPIAMFLITLWIYRSALHGVPPPAALASVFLPLGPCGQGSFGIALLGKVARDLAYNHSTSFAVAPAGTSLVDSSSRQIADAIYAGGLVTALILWGLGLVWYCIAFAVLIDHFRTHRDFLGHKKFSVGLWALTFPIGVFATATTELASQLDSPAFRVIGTVLSLQVVLHWVYVSVMTLWKVWDGTLFVAPELAGFEGQVPLRPLRRAKAEERV